MSATTNIIPFPEARAVARQTRRTCRNDCTSRSSGPNANGPRLGGQEAPSPSPLKARRLAGLLKAARRVILDAERRHLVKALQARATSEQWSTRETARHTGFPRTSLARLIKGSVNLEAWLPRLRAAVARIGRAPLLRSPSLTAQESVAP